MTTIKQFWKRYNLPLVTMLLIILGIGSTYASRSFQPETTCRAIIYTYAPRQAYAPRQTYARPVRMICGPNGCYFQ